ncbi:hypothetical protein Pelo_13762 [Pelomyxa schiedti]|nr:hypothetical protein Pelo_13762 [Pelomyxa schiedti]
MTDTSETGATSAKSPETTTTAPDPQPTSDTVPPAVSSAASTAESSASSVPGTVTPTAALPTEGTTTSTTTAAKEPPGPLITVTVIFKKQNFEIQVPDNAPVNELKRIIGEKTGVTPELQKLMLRGSIVKDSTAKISSPPTNIKNGAKFMLIGSAIEDVCKALVAPTPGQVATMEAAQSAAEPLCTKPQHKKILDKGLPDNAEPGFNNKHEPLPSTPLVGVLNHRGEKVRLTCKVYSQELWIATASHTERLPFGSIHTVTFEPIIGHEGYCLVQLHLGKEEASRYNLYWLPAQYSRALRDTILHPPGF